MLLLRGGHFSKLFFYWLVSSMKSVLPAPRVHPQLAGPKAECCGSIISERFQQIAPQKAALSLGQNSSSLLSSNTADSSGSRALWSWVRPRRTPLQGFVPNPKGANCPPQLQQEPMPGGRREAAVEPGVWLSPAWICPGMAAWPAAAGSCECSSSALHSSEGWDGAGGRGVGRGGCQGGD